MAQPRDKIAFCENREHPDPHTHVNPIVELRQTAVHIAMSGKSNNDMSCIDHKHYISILQNIIRIVITFNYYS